MTTTSRASIHGIDGCRAGWVVATRGDRGGRDAPHVAVLDRLDAVEAIAASVVGVDMPIGLPVDRPRSADRAARARLGPRRSSVFPTPPRVCLGATTHAEASARAREATGTGISVQAFHLLGKIAELDALVDPWAQDDIVEIHPECSFALLAGEPLPSKKTDDGRERRRAIVEQEFGTLPSVPRGASIDDVLDAFAVLWSAERWVAGTALVLGDGERDERGLVMRIVV
jgi:predicted RNase H-like nuclease